MAKKNRFRITDGPVEETVAGGTEEVLESPVGGEDVVEPTANPSFVLKAPAEVRGVRYESGDKVFLTGTQKEFLRAAGVID